jgi:hypothetical protein
MIGGMSANPGRPMTFGQMLDGAFSIYRNHFLALVGSVAVIVVPLAIAELVLREVGFLPAILLSLLPSAAAALVVAQAAEGSKPTVVSVWNVLTPKVIALIVTGLLVVLAIIAGFILLIIPGIIFAVWLSLVAPVIAIEDERYTAAMGRSRELVSGSWWRVLGILFTVNLVVGIVSGLIGVVVGSGSGFRPSPAETIVNAGVQLVISPYIAVVTALLYFDLRSRKEGSDIARSLEELGPLPPPEQQ